MTSLRKRLGKWLYSIAMAILPHDYRYWHFALIAFGETKMHELQEAGKDVDEEAQKLLQAWRDGV